MTGVKVWDKDKGEWVDPPTDDAPKAASTEKPTEKGYPTTVTTEPEKTAAKKTAAKKTAAKKTGAKKSPAKKKSASKRNKPEHEPLHPFGTCVPMGECPHREGEE